MQNLRTMAAAVAAMSGIGMVQRINEIALSIPSDIYFSPQPIKHYHGRNQPKKSKVSIRRKARSLAKRKY